MALTPVVTLAVDAAVEGLLALRASLVLDGLTLRAGTEAAESVSRLVCLRLLAVHGSLELFLRLEPSERCVVHPGVQDVDGTADDALGRELLRAKPVKHVILFLNSESVHTVL